MLLLQVFKWTVLTAVVVGVSAIYVAAYYKEPHMLKYDWKYDKKDFLKILFSLIVLFAVIGAVVSWVIVKLWMLLKIIDFLS